MPLSSLTDFFLNSTPRHKGQDASAPKTTVYMEILKEAPTQTYQRASLLPIHSATLALDRFGNPNSAYSFNGASSYIEVTKWRF
ncbi:MAG: hypothetical protein K2W99_08070 [Chthoniobacterales bacterium]|nr:hypothetical protein [Chthoniobacterales bacterium]